MGLTKFCKYFLLKTIKIYVFAAAMVRNRKYSVEFVNISIIIRVSLD